MSFYARSVSSSWEICLKSYDLKGDLLTLHSMTAKTIKEKWRIIREFLTACQQGEIRECAFQRNGNRPVSIVAVKGNNLHWSAPIRADLRGLV